MVKKDLREQAYDLSKFDDPVYVLKPGESDYVQLDNEYLTEIQGGRTRF